MIESYPDILPEFNIIYTKYVVKSKKCTYLETVGLSRDKNVQYFQIN